MRNLLLSVLAFAVTSFVCAEEVAPVAESSPICVTKHRPKLRASLDLLSWTPHQRGLDFAATEDGLALTIGSGQLHSVELDRDTGIRTQLGLLTDTGWGIDFGYTHFETEGRATVLRPPGTGQLFSTYSHPGGPEEADSASAFASIDYNVFDLSARRPIVNLRCVGLDLFGGLRWGDIRQEVSAVFDGRDFSNGVIETQSDVNAFGFRFGGQGEWRTRGAWSFFGTASVAALYAKIDNHRRETNFDGTQLLVDLRDPYTQPVFNLDTAMGISWQRRSWLVSAGYEFNIWTNLGDNLRFVDDIEEGSVTAIPGDLLLEGFFFRLGKTW